MSSSYFHFFILSSFLSVNYFLLILLSFKKLQFFLWYRVISDINYDISFDKIKFIGFIWFHFISGYLSVHSPPTITVCQYYYCQQQFTIMFATIPSLITAIPSASLLMYHWSCNSRSGDERHGYECQNIGLVSSFLKKKKKTTKGGVYWLIAVCHLRAFLRVTKIKSHSWWTPK